MFSSSCTVFLDLGAVPFIGWAIILFPTFFKNLSGEFPIEYLSSIFCNTAKGAGDWLNIIMNKWIGLSDIPSDSNFIQKFIS